ncbi:MAG: hypothetical protein P1U49_04580 [Minwuia sp.]|nr:hypothetical protein [Minwuia sp.]
MSSRSTDLKAVLTGLRFLAGVPGGRALLAPGLFVFLLFVAVDARAQEYPQTPEAMLEKVASAIIERDFDKYEKLVHWERAGRIKFNIVRYQVLRSMGRKIESITIEKVPPTTFDKLKQTPQIAFNLEPTHRIRVVYDEPPNVKGSDRKPVVFHLVGKTDEGYRIALVVRNVEDDDD